MKVTLNAQNRAIEKQNKSLFAAHIKGLKNKEKENVCLSNKLKSEFDSFDQSQISKACQSKQKSNMKHFQFLKQKCKDPTFKRITSFRDNKQISTQSYVNNNSNVYNNPELQQDRIKASLNQLKGGKADQLSHSTKANSRQKSRATSVDSSTVCCNLIKVERQDKFVNVQSKNKQIQPLSQVVSVQKNRQNRKISKILSPQISKVTRVIMLDWMFQLSDEIQLPRQALYNAIDYIDKFITLSEVRKCQYQQVGLACLFLATKLQISSHPRIQIFLEAMDNQLDRQVLIQTERKIVNTLKFRLNPPTLYQYMTVALLTIKTFKSEYKNIGWVNDLPSVQKESQQNRKIKWIMDGITMEGALTHKYGKDHLCFAILYIVMQSKANQAKSSPQQSYQKSKRVRHESTAYSDFSFSSFQKSFSPVVQEEQRFSFAFECFLRYATTSNKSIKDLQNCVQELRKWRSYTCECSDESSGYHPELKQLALSK